jgi:hypothetical protein
MKYLPTSAVIVVTVSPLTTINADPRRRRNKTPAPPRLWISYRPSRRRWLASRCFNRFFSVLPGLKRPQPARAAEAVCLSCLMRKKRLGGPKPRAKKAAHCGRRALARFRVCSRKS